MANACEHEWLDDTENWNGEHIEAVARCRECGELRIQPVCAAPYITLRVSLTEDRTEKLQEPLPSYVGTPASHIHEHFPGKSCEHDWGPWVSAVNKVVTSGVMRICKKCRAIELGP